MKSSPIDLKKTVAHRTYGAFENFIDQQLPTITWTEIVKNLRELLSEHQELMQWKREKEVAERDFEKHPRFDISLCTQGAVRDLIVKALDIHLMNGLDGDLLDIFSDLKGDSPTELKSEAFEIAKEQLMKQVMKGNTFFLDPQTMSDVPELGQIVAKILEVRNKQILRLEKNPPLTDVYSTYYGFTILTQGSIEQQVSGASEQAIEQFSQIAAQIGTGLTLNHKQLKYSKNAFGRVSEYTRQLLWNMLSLSTAGQNNRIRAIRELGSLRDSRAVPLLHLKLQASNDKSTIIAVIESFAKIGHPSSLEVLTEYSNSDWRIQQAKRDALRRLAASYPI